MINHPESAAPLNRSDQSQATHKYERTVHVSPTISSRVAGRNYTPQVPPAQSSTQIISTTYTTRTRIEPGDGSNLSIKSSPDYSRFSPAAGSPATQADARPALQAQPVESRLLEKEEFGPRPSEPYKLTADWDESRRTPEKSKPAPEAPKYSYSDSRYDNSYYKYTRDFSDKIGSEDFRKRQAGEYNPTYIVYEGQARYEARPALQPQAHELAAQASVLEGFKPAEQPPPGERPLGIRGFHREETRQENRASEQGNPPDSNLYNEDRRGILRESSIKESRDSASTPAKPDLAEKEQEGGQYFSFSPADDSRWLEDPKAGLPQFSSYSHLGGQKSELFEEVQRLSDSLMDEKREKDKLKNKVGMLQEKNNILEKELVEVKSRLVHNKKDNIDSMEERLQLLKDKQSAFERIDNLNRQAKLLGDQLEEEKANGLSAKRQSEWKLESKQRELDNKDKLIQALEARTLELESLAKSRNEGRTAGHFLHGEQTRPDDAHAMLGVDRLATVLSPFFDKLQQYYSKTRNTYASTVSGQVSKQLTSLKSSPSDSWKPESNPAGLTNLSILLDSLAKSVDTQPAPQLQAHASAKDLEESTNHRTYERSDSQQSNKMSTGSDRSVIIQERIEIINGKPAKVKYIRREPIITSREVSVEKKPTRLEPDNGSSQQSSPSKSGYNINLTQRLVEENARLAEEFSKVKLQNKSLKEKIDDILFKGESRDATAKTSASATGQYYTYQRKQSFGHN